MMSRAAPWPRESHTAPQKRDQSRMVSSSCPEAPVSEDAGEDLVDLAWRGNGDADTMERTCARLYGGKWIWGMPAWWSERG